MSVSSTCSNVSVGYKGGAMPLEQALDEVIRDLQKHLNSVQVSLRGIAMIVDQDNDFKEEVKLSDILDDDLREMQWLFSDLRQMSYDLISIPEEKEDKDWFKNHKNERKLNEKKLQSEHATQVKEERKTQKVALKAAKTLGDIDEEAEDI